MKFLSSASYGFFAALLLTAFSLTATAAPIEGCDQRVMDYMNAKAKAQAAYDKAVTDQIIRKPDSVLAMTCFNHSAGVSAKEGGAIFSGDFTTDLKKIIEPALREAYDDYDGSPGHDNNAVNYNTSGSNNAAELNNSATFSCDGIKNLWDQVRNGTVAQGVPYMNLNDLVTGANKTTQQLQSAGAGQEFIDSWQASNGIWSALSTAKQNLPRPSATPNFSSANSLCDVLKQQNNGVCPSGCQCSP